MLKRLINRVRESLAGAVSGWLSVSGNVSNQLRVQGLDRPAENLIWIYLGMSARTDAISQVPLRISTGNDTIVDRGALYDLIRQPNQWMDWVQYISMVEAYLALYNESYVAIVRGSRGEPLELVPLNPRYVTPVTGIHGPTGVRIPVGWKYMDPSVGELVVFKPEDMIPMVRYSPYDATRALWPSLPGKRAMQVDILAQEQNLAIFKNGGMPDVVFESDQPWNKDQRDEFMQAWEDRYGGTVNAHKPAILYGGLKAKAIGLSPEDLQFFEGRRMSRSEQIALIRVKPAMVGLMEGETGLSQGSSVVEQYASWWRSIGLGELALIAAAHQRFLVDRHAWAGSTTGRAMTREEALACQAQCGRMRRHGVRAGSTRSGLTVWFDEHEIEELMEQRLQKIDILGKLCDRGWTPDAAADYLALRLPPHPTNVATLPFSLQPAAELGGAVRETPALPTPGGKPDTLDLLLRDLDGALGDLAVSSRETDEAAEREDEDAIPQRWQSLRRVLDAFVAPRERAATRKWSRFFTEQRGRVLDRFAELRAEAGTREDDTPQLDDTELTPEGILEHVFPRRDEDDALAMRLLPLITEHMRDGFAFFGEHDMPAATVSGFAVDDPRVMAALDARRIQGSEVNSTTERQLRDVIRAGFAEGDTTAQLGDRIADYYGGQVGEKKARPMTAARTQTTGIINDGRMLAAREAGGLDKGWLHGGPTEPRDAHLDAQRRYLENPIPLDEKFEVNGHRADAPGSTELPVQEVANCTCTVTFVPARKAD